MNDSVVILSIASAITVAIPVLFAALGEIVANRCGVMNLGVEGMMLMGAVVGFWAGIETESLTIAMLAGGAAGASLALVHAALAVSLRVDQTPSSSWCRPTSPPHAETPLTLGLGRLLSNPDAG